MNNKITTESALALYLAYSINAATREEWRSWLRKADILAKMVTPHVFKRAKLQALGIAADWTREEQAIVSEDSLSLLIARTGGGETDIPQN